LAMDRTVTVKTPESIAFSYDLAGLGSRFLAVAVDFVIQVAIFIAVVVGLSIGSMRATGGSAHLHVTERTTASFAVAFFTVLVFAIFFAYFIAFEALWNGQTPGKKLLGLRVVRDGGYPIDLAGSAIRNLVRVGEATLGFYAISAIATLLSSENKRLGDMAAGTIVVRDSRVAGLAAIEEQAKERAKLPAELSDDELAVVDRFAARRSALSPDVRVRMAARLAGRLRPRLPPELRRLDDETLLDRLRSS
jgi:uncharacterized RDD family membrane protein YckC